jgi:hypothetical protein
MINGNFSTNFIWAKFILFYFILFYFIHFQANIFLNQSAKKRG